MIPLQPLSFSISDFPRSKQSCKKKSRDWKESENLILEKLIQPYLVEADQRIPAAKITEMFNKTVYPDGIEDRTYTAVRSKILILKQQFSKKGPQCSGVPKENRKSDLEDQGSKKQQKVSFCSSSAIDGSSSSSSSSFFEKTYSKKKTWEESEKLILEKLIQPYTGRIPAAKITKMFNETVYPDGIGRRSYQAIKNKILFLKRQKRHQCSEVPKEKRKSALEDHGSKKQQKVSSSSSSAMNESSFSLSENQPGPWSEKLSILSSPVFPESTPDFNGEMPPSPIVSDSFVQGISPSMQGGMPFPLTPPSYSNLQEVSISLGSSPLLKSSSLPASSFPDFNGGVSDEALLDDFLV